MATPTEYEQKAREVEVLAASSSHLSSRVAFQKVADD
jgi:hypothetical protein